MTIYAREGKTVFGYIRIQKSELLVREYDAYKAAYCGLCKRLGKDYSFVTRFILSYDCTFYSIFLMSVRRSCSGFKDGRCRFNPLKKCKFCQCTDDADSKAAALSVILAYNKLIDNIGDSSFFKRGLYKLVKPLFSRWRKKAAKRYTELDKIVSEMMMAQAEAESDPECGLDRAADPTATMLARVLELEAETESERRIYSQIGYGTGRFIYLIDAVDDYPDDVKSGNFNPFKDIQENKFDVMSANLSQAAASVFDAYNLLDTVDFRGIIDNIILRGLPSVQTEILDKVKEGLYEGSV